MKRSVLDLAGTLLVIVAFAGCSTGPQIISEWRNPAYGTGLFKRVMVAGPGGETSLRRNFEDEFLAQLRAAGIDALPSYGYLAEDQAVDENKLKQAAQKVGADALLFARSVRVESKTEPSGFYPYTSFGWFGEHFGASWSGIFGAPSAYRYNEYTSEATLYDLGKNEVVWTATIKTTEPENVRTAIRSYVEEVMKALDEKNLIRKRQ
jgi:hypothetical protein